MKELHQRYKCVAFSSLLLMSAYCYSAFPFLWCGTVTRLAQSGLNHSRLSFFVFKSGLLPTSPCVQHYATARIL